jgi:outer membrane assembly lipoprotein YfiO
VPGPAGGRALTSKGEPLSASRRIPASASAPALAFALALALAAAGCSSAPEAETPPAVRIANAAALVERERNTEAKAILEELRAPVAGTAQEAEVVYLLARARYGLEEYADAEVLFGTYLSRWPDGPHAAAALFDRALCFVRQAERLKIGFFSIDRELPFDRDITPLAQAETLLAEFLSRYPAAPEAPRATALVAELHEKRGLHELEIADFYLRQRRPAAALERARAVEQGDFPAAVRQKAGELARAAEKAQGEAQGTAQENKEDKKGAGDGP